MADLDALQAMSRKELSAYCSTAMTAADWPTVRRAATHMMRDAAVDSLVEMAKDLQRRIEAG